MTDSADDRRFVRAPRRDVDPSAGEKTRANFRDSLDAIDIFLAHASGGGRSAFVRNSPAYATGSMAIIRAAALFESEEFAPFLVETSEDVARAIRTTRHIASHAGYRAMNDEVFWTTLTVHLPPLVAQWRRAADR